MNLETPGSSWDTRKNEAMLQAIVHARLPIIITDPNLPDNPIVFCNEAFTALTGYSEADVVGRNCRFLQGPETTPESIEAVRQMVVSRAVDTVEVINYRKDGSKFINALQIGPIVDDEGETVFFFGSQINVSEKHAAEERAKELSDRELLHRLRNIVNVMTVITRMTAREDDNVETLAQKIVERLYALGEVHFDTILASSPGQQGVGDIARTILAAYAPLGAQQFWLSGDEFGLPQGLVTPVTLVLHELATNAVKHGALGSVAGRVSLEWRIEDGALRIVWTERNGPQVKAPQRDGGAAIMRNMTEGAGGTLAFDWQGEGLTVTITYPWSA